MEQPRHWDGEKWRHAPARRATADEPRKPLTVIPENLPAVASKRERSIAAAYWEGMAAGWEDLVKTVEDGQDVILFPWRSELVVVDCDVKHLPVPVLAAEEGKKVIRHGDLTRTEKGISQLVKLVEGEGHRPEELATYTVATPSGGLHLYFRQNEKCRIEKTSHHREGWRVDVIVSENLWAAAPPTSGYRVVRDTEAAVMPEWLAALLSGVSQRFPRCGGQRSRVTDASREELLELVKEQLAGGGAADGSIIRQWVRSELRLVAVSSWAGGWNAAVYQATCNLGEYGWPWEAVSKAVMEAAAPWNERERRNALATMRSAWGKVRPGELASLASAQ